MLTCCHFLKEISQIVIETWKNNCISTYMCNYMWKKALRLHLLHRSAISKKRSYYFHNNCFSDIWNLNLHFMESHILIIKLVGFTSDSFSNLTIALISMTHPSFWSKYDRWFENATLNWSKMTQKLLREDQVIIVPYFTNKSSRHCHKVTIFSAKRILCLQLCR